jgi:hypothetical protein
MKVERLGEVRVTARRGDGSEFSFMTATPDRYMAPEPFNRRAWLLEREQRYLRLLDNDLTNGARARLVEALEWIRSELASRH